MIIKNAKVVLPTEVAEADVEIVEGRIGRIGSDLSGEPVVDGRGRYLLPMAADIGVRVRDKKLRRGTLARLSAKARRSGFGTIVLSSFADPPVDNEIALEFVKSQAELCRDADIRTLIRGVDGEDGLADCATLLDGGGMGLEFDSHIDGNRIRRLMEYAKMRGVHLFCHADDPDLRGDGVMQEGAVSARLGLPGVPEVAEVSQVARIGAFAAAYEVPVVVLHASTPETLAICRENPWLHAQVPLHHLLLNDTACEGFETAAKIWPPLRGEASQKRLREALRDGRIDLLTSLHSPVSETAKDAVFADAAWGIDALEDFWPLLYTYLIAEGELSWPEAVRLCATRAAETVGLAQRKGRIETGYDADLIWFDPTVTRTVETPVSPYRGWTIQGVVEPLVDPQSEVGK